MVCSVVCLVHNCCCCCCCWHIASATRAHFKSTHSSFALTPTKRYPSVDYSRPNGSAAQRRRRRRDVAGSLSPPPSPVAVVLPLHPVSTSIPTCLLFYFCVSLGRSRSTASALMLSFAPHVIHTTIAVRRFKAVVVVALANISCRLRGLKVDYRLPHKSHGAQCKQRANLDDTLGGHRVENCLGLRCKVIAFYRICSTCGWQANIDVMSVLQRVDFWETTSEASFVSDERFPTFLLALCVLRVPINRGLGSSPNILRY